MTKAILLVGGKGTRLAPLTNQTPKPMLKVAGKPVTEHQIVKAREAGITEIVLATSYMAEVFEPYFGDGSKFGITIQYAVEETPMGTGGAIANAADLLSLKEGETVAVFNGDVLSAHNLSAQLALHHSKGADVTLYLTQVSDARAYGCVPVDDEGRVLEFLEKMENPKANTINAGCYVFSQRAIASIPRKVVVSVERETFPNLLTQKFKVFGFVDKNYWIDMGTPQSFIRASRDLILQPSLSPATSLNRSHKYPDAIVESGATVHESAEIGGGSFISSGAIIGAQSNVQGSIIMDNATVGDNCRVENSYVGVGQAVVDQSTVISEILG